MRQRRVSQSPMPPSSSLVLKIIIANVVIYVLYLVGLRVGLPGLDRLLLVPREVLTEGAVWQLVTSVFLHDPVAPSHLLWNMLLLWMFGAQLESLRGSRTTLKAYAAGALGGGLFTLLFGGLTHALAPADSSASAWWSVAHLGASGAINGIFACWAGTLWRQRVSFMFFGELEARTFFLIFLGIELLGALSLGGGVSVTSHLGGMAVGLAMGRDWLNLRRIRLLWERRRIQAELARLEAERTRKGFQVIRGGKDQDDMES
ncbi:rhomboid family intramembrane serine protease [Myxococcota bacterium]|nr:rhomboid family intramembrane serine protease [Myxococcota bacterium]